MIVIFGAQRDFDMAQIFITQSSDLIGSYLMEKSQSALNFESSIGAENFLG